VASRVDCTELAGRRRGIERACSAIAQGGLVVFPVDSAYGLGCDAFSRNGTERLRALKGHGRHQPPPVLIGHPRTLDGITTALSDAARALTGAFWPGPLTLLCRTQPTLGWDLGDDGGTVAVRMPLHPLALELLARTGPLAVTGAGAAGQPPPQTCAEVREAFGDDVEVYLDAGHLNRPEPSSIVDVTSVVPRLLRPGAVDVAQLRAVVPELVADDDQDLSA
jgi:L-threonylcarbamoyladenylate synthase